MTTDCGFINGSEQTMGEREIIDQLGTTGTYVTRDGDGVLRHWNAITDEYVGSETDVS